MTNDWKLVLKVIVGSVVLLLVMIFGLSKMGGSGTTLTVDQIKLIEGAKLIKENGDTKVNVVVFSDMECPACKRADELMTSLETTNGVRTVIRHYPLSIHKNAPITARAVEAARLLGKGFEMVDLLFSKQEEWTNEAKMETKLVEYATSLGLDGKTFLENLNSPEVGTTVQQDINLGNSLRLSGTPTIYVNGEQVAPDFAVAKVTELLNK